MEHINRLEKEIADLRIILQEKEAELYRIKNEWLSAQQMNMGTNNCIGQQHQYENGTMRTQICEKLPKWAIERYSRQILLPNIGVKGQEKLCAAKVLIVGAGGLGCPAAILLAGAGVGEISIVDYDTVDVTNIHRQFLYQERDQYTSKAESAAAKLRSLNSHIKVTAHNTQLDSRNALHIAREHDLVLDCTDNVPTRYLLNDTCVLAKIPLISGSALKMEGQLTVYGYRANKNANETEPDYIGPCYRCLFPNPPPAAAVGSCSANGVAGPVPAAIGALQALEAIKCLVGETRPRLLVERLLLFDGDDMIFRTVKLRPRSASCAVCSDAPTITRLVDYEAFCQAQAKEKRKQESRLNAEQRKCEKEKRMSGRRYYGFRCTSGADRKWVQDVPKSERRMGPACASDICAKGTLKRCPSFDQPKREALFGYFWNELDWKGKRAYVRSLVDSVPVKRRRMKHKGEDLDLNILPPEQRISPEDLLRSLQTNCLQRHLLIDVRSEPEFHMCNIDGSTNCPIEKVGEKIEELVKKIKDGCQMTFICRRGNDSQLVAQKVLDQLDASHRHRVKDLRGGLHSWAKYVDTYFPIY